MLAAAGCSSADKPACFLAVLCIQIAPNWNYSGHGEVGGEAAVLVRSW